jgi:hypothetical protein
MRLMTELIVRHFEKKSGAVQENLHVQKFQR